MKGDEPINCLDKSRQLFDQAVEWIPGGINRDVVNLDPFPVYIERSSGSRSWDIDGNEYVDLIAGNGSIILGHNDLDISNAICAQAALGLHSGFCNVNEVKLAKKICELVPCAESVRFTMTGSEATQLALRLARSYTNRDKYIRFSGNFHGWHDGVAIGSNSGSCSPDSRGIPQGSSELAYVCSPNDIESLTNIDPKTVSAIILEPSGGKAGLEPFKLEFLHFLRDYCDTHNIVFIFDEIVTGFRWSPGGAQYTLGITPDLSTLGKVLGGGLPCAAVCGKKGIMQQLSFRSTSGKQRVHHGGTFNANPLAAVSGLTALEKLEDGYAIERVNAYNRRLIKELSGLWEKLCVPGAVYGEASVFHCVFDFPTNLRSAQNLMLSEQFQKLLLRNGVLMRKMTGMLSCAHNDKDMVLILSAVESSLTTMKENGLFK